MLALPASLLQQQHCLPHACSDQQHLAGPAVTVQAALQASSPAGSQADQRGWWRSSKSEAARAQHSRAQQGLPGQDSADDASCSDAASAMSFGDIPKAAYTPPSQHGSADAAWGQDAEEEASDTLMPLLSTSLKGPLPTVMEHFDEGIGMSRPQSLADLSKAGWTVDNALLQASATTNLSRMSRISSFPNLPTMPETVTDSTGGSPPQRTFPPYASQQGMADLSNRWAALLDASSLEPAQGNLYPAAQPSLNPNAVTFQPGLLSARLRQKPVSPSDAANAPDMAEKQQRVRSTVAGKSTSSQAATHQAAEFLIARPTGEAVSNSHVELAGDTVGPQDGFAAALFTRQKSVSIAELARQAEKSVAKRLLLKKRTSSFGKSKSCNDLAAAEPKSPTRSPLAPLMGNVAQ